MKIINIFVGAAVVAVAGANVYIASDIQGVKNDLTLETVELTASGVEMSNVVEPPGYYDGVGGSQSSSSQTPVINVYVFGTTFFMTWEETDQYNSFWGMFSQGILKDEREEHRLCPTLEVSSGNGSIDAIRIGASGAGKYEQYNQNGRYEIICPYGSVNCTEIGC